jgi:hypothetical protein
LLFFRGGDAAAWRVRVLLLAEGAPPALSLQGSERSWQAIWRYGALTAYASDLELPRGADAAYAVGGQTWRVRVPAPRAQMRIACTSCNGEEDEDPSQWRGERDLVWRHLAESHAGEPYHLMFQLGDQIYADPVWDCDPWLARWRRARRRKRAVAAFPEPAQARVRDFYVQRYIDTMRGEFQSRLYAEVPQVCIWDDHDIFDGWGSWHDSDQDSPVFQGLFAAAREAYQVFQRGDAPGRDVPASADPAEAPQADGVVGPAPPLGLSFRLDDCLIVVPDLRSERRRTRMLGEAGWRFLEEALDQARDVPRLLLLSSVPFLNANLAPLERLLVALPGQQPHQDDLRDQWTSYRHRGEWRRLEARLAELVAGGTEITLLSGEIHLGALGVAETGGGSYLQGIAPGVAHRPPPRAFVRVLEWLARGRSSPGRPGGLVPLPNQDGRRYLARRGWIDLELPEAAPARLRWRGPEVDRLEIALEHPGPAPAKRAGAAVAG